MEDRPRRQRYLVPTPSAFPAPEFYQLIRASISTTWTDETNWPAAGGQVLLASLLVGELLLELAQSLRKWRTGHAYTLPLGAS